MTPREKRLLNALRFVKACPDVYYGRSPATVIDCMKTAATMAIEDEHVRSVKRKKAA